MVSPFIKLGNTKEEADLEARGMSEITAFRVEAVCGSSGQPVWWMAVSSSSTQASRTGLCSHIDFFKIFLKTVEYKIKKKHEV